MNRGIIAAAAAIAALLIESQSSEAQTAPGGSNGQIQYNNNGAFGGDAITTNGSGLLDMDTATISGNSAPTADAIVGTNNGDAQNFYFYHTTRDNLMLGFSDGQGLYPNPSGSFDTLVGMRAGANLTSGSENPMYGAETGHCVTTGGNNAAFGDNALGGIDTCSPTTSGGISDSVAVGHYAGASMLSAATLDVVMGYQAGQYMTSPDYDVLVGALAGEGTSGTPNSGNGLTAIGSSAGQNNSTGNYSTEVGFYACNNVTTASYDVCVGSNAARYLTTGADNVAVGTNTLGEETGSTSTSGTVASSIAIGFQSFGYAANGAINDVAIGTNSGQFGSTNTSSVWVGASAGEGQSSSTQNTGNGQTAVGYAALQNVTTGSYQTAIGYEACNNVTTALYDTCLGANAGLYLSTGANNLAIGTNSMGWAGSAGTAGTISDSVAIGHLAGAGMQNGATLDVAIGYESGQYQSTNLYTTFIGALTGEGTSTTANSGNGQTAVGYAALQNASTAAFDTALGYLACNNVTTASYNICIGSNAGLYLTTGADNVGIGTNSLGKGGGSTSVSGTIANTVAVGYMAGSGLQNGASSDVIVGFQAGQYASTNTSAVLIGANAGAGTSTTANSGNGQTAVGYGALQNASTTTYDTAIGYEALNGLTTATGNVAVGANTLLSDQTGADNTSVGLASLRYITTGNNTALGYQAGAFISGGSTQNTGATNGVFVGYNAFPLAATDANEIVVGATTVGNGSNTVTIGNSSITATYLEGAAIYDVSLGATTGDALCWNTTSGAIGTDTSNCIPSTLSLKHDVKTLDDADEIVRKLAKDAIYYRLNGRDDLGEMPGFGAEWVQRDDKRYADPRGNGGPGVRYEQMVAASYVAISHLFDARDAARRTIGTQDREIAMLRAQLTKDELRIARLERNHNIRSHRHRAHRDT